MHFRENNGQSQGEKGVICQNKAEAEDKEKDQQDLPQDASPEGARGEESSVSVLELNN